MYPNPPKVKGREVDRAVEIVKPSLTSDHPISFRFFTHLTLAADNILNCEVPSFESVLLRAFYVLPIARATHTLRTETSY
jgi:hypothetical protein